MDLYNLYRQREFKEMFKTSEIITSGDSMIRNTLDHKLPGVPQFMIFHSDHGGVGKTTVGRIMVTKLNPDMTPEEIDNIFNGRPSQYFYEINAGNYRKIDDMRALDSKVKYQSDMVIPFNIVYMINEAHQLTPDSQQVFLQMIENLPEHIRFIFTTTSLTNLNEKLISRAKLYKFTSVDKDSMRKLLVDIAGRVGVSVLPEYVTDRIYEYHGHSIRKCINELETFISTGKVADSQQDDEDIQSARSILWMLVRLARNDGKASWTKDILPALNRLLTQCSPEEARIKFSLSLRYMIQEADTVTRKGLPMFVRISEELAESAALPPEVDLKFKFLRLYNHALELNMVNKEEDKNAGDDK